MSGYYDYIFEDMKTSTIQSALRQAQIDLSQSKGAVREILCEIIRCAARELLFRYRENMRNLL
jgi:hypothetical protein